MSFSLKVKEEITKQELPKPETISLLSSFLRNNAVVNDNSIIINSENEIITRYIFEKFKELYDIVPLISVKKNFNFKKNLSYTLEIKNKKDLILKDLSLINNEGYFINTPKQYIIEDDESKKSYIKGIFLSTGSISNPKSSNYHLEFLIDDYDYAIFLCDLLDDYNLNGKIIERKNGFIVYIKESEKISDFLKIIKAYNAVLYFEDIRIYKENRNIINRMNNCEQANVEKVFNSAFRQLKDIDLIDETIGLDILESKLKEVAIYRRKYPEMSLLELSKRISKDTNRKLSKSGINHRFRKIREMASKFEK